ncbi:MAG: hypothetical protein OXG09_00015 [Chloroflexi bacterium]|nr:hypothetical protein [Chloroflexota bacterium]
MGNIDVPGAVTDVRFEVALRAPSVTVPAAAYSFTVYVDGTAVATVAGWQPVPADN